MCAQFLIKIRIEELKKKFGLILIQGLESEILEGRILPYQPAPVIINNGQGNVLKKMSFSLVPHWSKERKVKFATHNARIETIAEKPTWKVPFQTKRALVPISRFVEPIYLNDLAGNMVQFFQKDHSILAAAAIYDEWVDPKTGEILESFSIITSEPPAFIEKVGHDRCPVFLVESAYDEWLKPGSKDPQFLIEFLKSHTQDLDLEVAIDRPLAKGWEKRIPS
jgi:putative SOS response-associated peptidase YedK